MSNTPILSILIAVGIAITGVAMFVFLFGGLPVEVTGQVYPTSTSTVEPTMTPTPTPPAEPRENADVDKDGDVDVFDALAVLEFIVGGRSVDAPAQPRSLHLLDEPGIGSEP